MRFKVRHKLLKTNLPCIRFNYKYNVFCQKMLCLVKNDNFELQSLALTNLYPNLSHTTILSFLPQNTREESSVGSQTMFS